MRLGGLVRRQVQAHLDEIADDAALRATAAALALLHALTAYWLLHHDLAELLGRGADAICWPLFPDCERARVLSAPALEILFRLYGVASLAVAAAFWRRDRAPAATVGLFLLTVLKLAILALDFRLRRNQHYMALAATGVFLVVPNKREALRLLLVLFYVWAGTLKLSWEWLSGGALYRPLWLFTGVGVVVACAYVIVMELVVVWGLLARRRWIFWAAFAQVITFHVFSWNVVGYFYPLVMFCLLAVFPLCRLLGPRDPAEGLGVAWWRGRGATSSYVVAAAFSALQLAPHLYPGDTTLTGEGRLFALHMFDAQVECDAGAVLRFADGNRQHVDLRGGEPRTGCDPIFVAGNARNLCRHRDAGDMTFTDLELTLRSRRTTDDRLTTVIALDDFCARAPGYDPVLHNDWIAAVSP